MSFICFNGKWHPAHQPIFTAQNRGFRYGDGLFETIKVYRQQVMLADFHFERLFLGLRLLNIEVTHDISSAVLTTLIKELCQKNNCIESARVRLAVYRGAENKANFVIEAVDLPTANHSLNEKGWVIDIYPFARKSNDAFANLKSANYLPFVLADRHATENGLDDCVVLNAENHVCETSKTNIFLVIKNEVHTPALHQGCVNGVMRRHLIQELKKINIPVHQRKIEESLLHDADELFLTNAVQGLRWVSSFKEKQYGNSFTTNMYQQIVAPLFQ